MKKLTAGIFATILGLTAMGAADAAIPTQNYVDEAVGSVRSTVTQMALNLDNYATKTYADQAEADAISTAAADATTKANKALEDAKAYADANDADTIYDDTALAARVGANETAIGTLNTEQDTQDAAIKALQDAGYITNAALDTYATKAYAESEADAAEAAAIAAAATDATTKANAAEAAAIAAAATDATTKANQALEDAKAYADANDADTIYDDTALAARVGANETAIGTLNTEQDTQDAAIKALQDAGYITNAALTGYATEAYADQAEADAISTAAADATTKANKALEDAKAYADANDADTIYDDTELTAEVGKKINTPTVACSDPDGCVLMADGTWQGVVNTYVGE